MNSFKALNSVCGYYLPEIRAAITDLTREYPHDIFLRSVSPGPNDFHVPIIEKLVAAHQHDVLQLWDFPECYPTAGADEGIREYMTFLQGKGVKRIYMWNGDCECYYDVAKTRNITAVPIDYDANPEKLVPGCWFISNPSARNGMIVPDEKIQDIMAAGHRVFYDMSYLGTTHPYVFNVSHPNIVAVAISFSAPYGLATYRIGFTFCREPIPSLESNKSLKNIFGLLIAERILDTLDLVALAGKYKGVQAKIVEQINRDYDLGLSAGDSFLFAKTSATAVSKLPVEYRNLIGKFRRSDWYRFCLAPYFADYDGGS